MNTCTWLIEIPNNPTPPAHYTDEDLDGWYEWQAEIRAENPWRTTECGAPITELTDGWTCAAGHHHYYYGSASQIAEEREEAWAELNGIDQYNW
jgi:hypothetical protein